MPDFLDNHQTETNAALATEAKDNSNNNSSSADEQVKINLADDAAQAHLKDAIIAALKEIYDPEIPVNIYDLGLIYAFTISADNDVSIQMTLTAPGCPVAHSFPATVEQGVTRVEGVNSATVILVWDPPWTQARMSEVARVQLGLFD